jgi:NAD(P)-dependent dehydrogenase (short-subunit alcohol dehydrogenase family)
MKSRLLTRDASATASARPTGEAKARVDAERPKALVTGASFGIGAAIAEGLAADGFDLAISATKTDNLRAIASMIEAAGARVVKLSVDLARADSVRAAVEDAVDALGRVDVLVNNAAVVLRKDALELTPDDWERVMQANVAGTFFSCQAMARHLVATGRSGCIINLASTHGIVGCAGVAAYGVSKAAIVHMTKTLAVEWAQYAIRVNAVAPGTVETLTRKKTLADRSFKQAILDSVPLHRLGSAEEVAGAVRYLASRLAAYVTGQTLLVDGGVTACGARGTGVTS